MFKSKDNDNIPLFHKQWLVNHRYDQLAQITGFQLSVAVREEEFRQMKDWERDLGSLLNKAGGKEKFEINQKIKEVQKNIEKIREDLEAIKRALPKHERVVRIIDEEFLPKAEDCEFYPPEKCREK